MTFPLEVFPYGERLLVLPLLLVLFLELVEYRLHDIDNVFFEFQNFFKSRYPFFLLTHLVKEISLESLQKLILEVSPVSLNIIIHMLGVQIA